MMVLKKHIHFVQESAYIATVNKDISEIHDSLRDIMKLSKPFILFNPNDTKLKYPEVFKTFSEATIYKAFIKYCKYDSALPISDDLRIVWNKATGFDPTLPLNKQIQMLKAR